MKMRETRDILTSETYYKMKFNKKKKEVKILIRAILELSKKIRKLKKQEQFLNELLDKKVLEELKAGDKLIDSPHARGTGKHGNGLGKSPADSPTEQTRKVELIPAPEGVDVCDCGYRFNSNYCPFCKKFKAKGEDVCEKCGRPKYLNSEYGWENEGACRCKKFKPKEVKK